MIFRHQTVGVGVWIDMPMKLTNHSRPNSILCGDLAIKLIEEPFISNADDNAEWAI